MELNGPGFHVDVDAVSQAATGISRSVEDQDNFELDDLCGDAERWSNGLDALAGDAEVIGESLTRVAQTYRAH